MKVGFFLLKFPLSSETFVLNQITAFIDMGYDVEIIALQKGDTQNTHAAWTQYGLEAKTRWLQDEPRGQNRQAAPGGAYFVYFWTGRAATTSFAAAAR